MGPYHGRCPFCIQQIAVFLGPRGPLIEPSISARPSFRKKNPDHLYSLINHRRTTVNLSKYKKGKREKGKKGKRKKGKKGKGKKGNREKEKREKKRKKKKRKREREKEKKRKRKKGKR